MHAHVYRSFRDGLATIIVDDGLSSRQRNVREKVFKGCTCPLSSVCPAQSTLISRQQLLSRSIQISKSSLSPLPLVKMQFSQVTLGLLAMFGSLAIAAPAPSEAAKVAVESTPKDGGDVGILGIATVKIFRSDTCGDLVDQVTIFQGGYRCIPYSNVRSIDLSNRYVSPMILILTNLQS